MKAAVAAEVAYKWITPTPLLNAAPPLVEDCLLAAQRARQSSPGPDGVSLAAWAAAGLPGTCPISGIEEIAGEGVRLPLEFNASNWIFI